MTVVSVHSCSVHMALHSSECLLVKAPAINSHWAVVVLSRLITRDNMMLPKSHPTSFRHDGVGWGGVGWGGVGWGGVGWGGVGWGGLALHCIAIHNAPFQHV